MSNAIQSINKILEPVLFQVIGTTPESLADSVKRAGLEGKLEAGVQLASICIFAASVNKNVLGEFLLKPELVNARQTVVSQFSIQNKANMTALTLLGHCLYLTSFAGQINYAVEFRKKMGQQNIWDGNLEGGSLSEIQRKILSEKGKAVNKSSARLFATGFLKYIGADTSKMTADEARFWDVQTTTANISPPRRPATRTPSVSSASPQTSQVTLADGKIVSLSTRAYNYYMTVNNNDLARLTASVNRDGPTAWSASYDRAAELDPEMQGTKGAGTVVPR
jgi:hypothetical protein